MPQKLNIFQIYIVLQRESIRFQGLIKKHFDNCNHISLHKHSKRFRQLIYYEFLVACTVSLRELMIGQGIQDNQM